MPPTQIVEAARDCGAGLVVVDSRRFTGLTRAVLGSVARTVLGSVARTVLGSVARTVLVHAAVSVSSCAPAAMRRDRVATDRIVDERAGVRPAGSPSPRRLGRAHSVGPRRRSLAPRAAAALGSRQLHCVPTP